MSTVVLFVGWSQTQTNHIFAAGEYDSLPTDWIPAGGNVDIVDADVTLYAIWGWSTDGDGPPDVLRDSFNIYYEGNAQQGGTVSNMPTDQLHLLPGTHATRNQEPTHTNVDRDVDGTDVSTVVLFVGWSQTQTNHIFAAGERDSLPTDWIPAGGDVDIVDADVTLYAIWGWSTDGDGPPDVRRDSFNIYYEGNAQQGGTVSNMPADQLNLLPGTHATRTQEPTHTNVDRDVDGTDVSTVVLFVGWSQTQTNHIFAAGERDSLPTDWIPAGGDVDIVDADVTLYAIWVWSTDGDGPPDVLRDSFNIYYEGNAQQGGTVSNMPTDQLHLLPGTHGLGSVVPEHSDVNNTRVLFVG